MSLSITTPITGAAVNLLTAPTYSLTADAAPNNYSVQYAVSSLGGTQSGVSASLANKPFTLTLFRPQVIRQLPSANPVTGVVKNVPINTYKLVTRKAVTPASGQNPVIARMTTTIDVPAGADVYDLANIEAMLSAHAGALAANVDSISDTIYTGIM